MSFPTALPSYTDPTPGQTLDTGNHTALHIQNDADIIALATKMGTGASTPTSGMLLRGNGTGTSVWGQAALTTDVTGVLPIANGGNGTTSTTGSGSAVFGVSPTISGAQLTGSPTLTTPTLTTPVITDFGSATHTHASNTQGGQLNGANALQNTTVTADKLNTGAQQAYVSTAEGTTSATYTDLATTTDTVTVTIGANGLALVAIYGSILNNIASSIGFIGVDVSGATTTAASDDKALSYTTPPGGANFYGNFGATFLITGLAAGSTTFKLKYRVNANTGTFGSRRIAVVPL